MNEKEVLLESIRTRVAAIVGAIVVLITALTGLFPDLKVIEVNQDMVELLIAAITALAGFFIIGRSIRNTRAK
jgi:ribonuclease PH